MKPIMLREFVPSTEMHQTEWQSLRHLMKWVRNNGFQYAIRSVENIQYLFVLKDKRTDEDDPPEQVLVYVIRD